MTSAFPISTNNSASDILVGQLFWSVNDSPRDGLLFSGRTYSWLDNPKLKQLFDNQGHLFITDNLDNTFTVEVVTRNIKGTQDNTLIGSIPLTGENLTAPGANPGDNQLAIFGIYGDQATVAIDTTLASKGDLLLPDPNEWTSTEDSANLVSNDDLELPGTDQTNVAPSQLATKNQITNELFPYTLFSVIDLETGDGSNLIISDVLVKDDTLVSVRNLFPGTVVTLELPSTGDRSTYSWNVDGFSFQTGTPVPNSIVEIPALTSAQILVSLKEETVYVRPFELGVVLPDVTQADLAQEISDRQAADAAIISDVNTRALDSDLQQEILDRQNADSAIQSSIPIVWEDLDNVDFTNTPVNGSTFRFDGSNVVPSSTLLIDVDGCSIETKDETGKDWCNWQYGSTGSAFVVLKQSLGSISTPLAVTSGTKIGGFGFVGDDLVTIDPGYVGAEVFATATETHTATGGGTTLSFEATPIGTKSPVLWLTTSNDSEPVLPQYPNTRDDGPTSKVLYTTTTGQLQLGSPEAIPPGYTQYFSGHENGSSSFTILDDDYVTIIWNGTAKQPQYLQKSTAPISWGRPCFTAFKIDGNTATTNGNSAWRRTGGRPTLVLDTFHFYSRSKAQVGSFNMEDFGSIFQTNLSTESFTSGFPSYRLDLFTCDNDNVYYEMKVIGG